MTCPEWQRLSAVLHGKGLIRAAKVLFRCALYGDETALEGLAVIWKGSASYDSKGTARRVSISGATERLRIVKHARAMAWL